MSRRTFDHADDTWTVGYDRPLHTFYAQVEPRAALAHDPAQRAAFSRRHPTLSLYDPHDLLLTVAGDSHHELPTVDQLANALAARGVSLPPGVRSLLEHDQSLEDPAPQLCSGPAPRHVEQAARRAAGGRPRTVTTANSSLPNRRR